MGLVVAFAVNPLFVFALAALFLAAFVVGTAELMMVGVLPLVADGASSLAGLGGGLAGIVLGLGLARAR